MGADKSLKMRVVLLLAALATANAIVRMLRPQYYSDSTCTKLVGSGPTTYISKCAPAPYGTYDGTKYTEAAKPKYYRTWYIYDTKNSVKVAVCGKPDSGTGQQSNYYYSDSACKKMTGGGTTNLTADFYKCKATLACKVDGCDTLNATQTRLLYTKLLCSTDGVGALAPSMLLAAVMAGLALFR